VHDELPRESANMAPMDIIFMKSLLVCDLSSMFPFRFGWRWFRFQRLEFWVMGIVTIYAKEIDPFPSLEIADPFAVDTDFPVPIDIAVALSAKQVRLRKLYRVPIGKLQSIPVFRIVTIETPAIVFGMVQFDVGMLVLKFPSFRVDFHPRMAVAARKYPLGQRRRGNGIFIMVRCERRRAQCNDCEQA
jgi:hypothetical protein